MIDEKKELQTPETVKKRRAINPEIIVRMIDDKPYYSIRYFNLDDCRWHVGYSSYKLEFVAEWLRTCFDIVDTKSRWIPVSERLPDKVIVICDVLYEENEIDEAYHDIKILNYIGDGKFVNSWNDEKNVIAWQPLPDPYKEEQ